MFSEAKVTEIYSLADDFCKEFAKYQENHMLPTFHKSGKHRNKPNRMSVAEIMLIMILFHSGGYRCFKHFYLEYVCKHLAHLFLNGKDKVIVVLTVEERHKPLLAGKALID